MSEGQDVRRAYDGPDIDHDKLIDTASRHNSEDAERASSAAETRQDIGQFIEQTGINNKAYSVLRQIMKVSAKSRDKAMDVIRSLEKGLPMVKAHIAGQSEMDLEPSEPVAEDDLPQNFTEHDLSPEEVEFGDEVDRVVGFK